ncbi:MAG TPA: polyphenol oxidase family protein [Acidimicrobiales bacterium]|nr:polyphenol oxidase family protein [Acidimicrobiales bacterium]
MTPPRRTALPGGVEALWTGRSQGDLGLTAGAGVDDRRRAVVDRPWSYLRQVHGAGCVVVTQAGEPRGADGDALVTARPDAALAVFTADCAPVALASPDGVFAAVHAGWRGLAAGVLEAAVDAMRTLGAADIVAALGPCIRPECYEFSPTDLDMVAARLGDEVRADTASGRAALDLPRAVAASVEAAGARLHSDAGVCTSCSAEHYSHRARAETERQAMAVWRP